MTSTTTTLTIVIGRNFRMTRKIVKQSSQRKTSFRILLVSILMALEVILLGAPALTEDTIILASVRTVWFAIKPFLLRVLRLS
jgi:hypothetical protein